MSSVTATTQCCPPKGHTKVTKDMIETNKMDLAVSVIRQIGEMLYDNCFVTDYFEEVIAIPHRSVNEGIHGKDGVIVPSWQVFNLDPICENISTAAQELVQKGISKEDARNIQEFIRKIEEILRTAQFQEDCLKFQSAKKTLFHAETYVQQKEIAKIADCKIFQHTILFFIEEDGKLNPQLYNDASSGCIIQ